MGKKKPLDRAKRGTVEGKLLIRFNADMLKKIRAKALKSRQPIATWVRNACEAVLMRGLDT